MHQDNDDLTLYHLPSKAASLGRGRLRGGSGRWWWLVPSPSACPRPHLYTTLTNLLQKLHISTWAKQQSTAHASAKAFISRSKARTRAPSCATAATAKASAAQPTLTITAWWRRRLSIRKGKIWCGRIGMMLRSRGRCWSGSFARDVYVWWAASTFVWCL